MKKVNNNKRILYFDILRSLAILFVILCHCVENAYPNLSNLSNQSQLFRIIMFTIGRLGVPIFFFLTGALILKKNFNNDDDVRRFYKHNLLSLLITVEIWIILYNIFNFVMYKEFSLKNLIFNMLLFSQCNNMVHMWYMPVILGIYLALPFISKILKIFSKKLLLSILFISIFINFIIPTINVCTRLMYNFSSISSNLDCAFFGSTYGCYIIVGYFLDNGLLNKVKNYQLLILLFVSFSLTVWLQYYSISTSFTYMVWYNFLTLLICGMCIYEFIKRLFNSEKVEKISNMTKNTFHELSKISLAIYFLHMPFILLYKKYISIDLSKPMLVVTSFLFTLILSIITTKLLSKNKFMEKYILSIK